MIKINIKIKGKFNFNQFNKFGKMYTLNINTY